MLRSCPLVVLLLVALEQQIPHDGIIQQLLQALHGADMHMTMNMLQTGHSGFEPM